MQLQESGEMYLETIYVLSQQSNYVRSIDVSEYMGYSKPSVSRAVGILRKGGYLEDNADGFLVLTEEGRKIAEKTYERHRLLTELFMRLGVSEKTASEDACKIEHDLSDETFAAIKRHATMYSGDK
ncbi:MAG: metal-dependent transcriptional regulator [Clostridia bacterium]|nr:metal-dependent transcriptional regulator [Clostridia bacterium]MBQ9994104.1 metal-dependent transcriptional regulator [Clostridia bacterium]